MLRLLLDENISPSLPTQLFSVDVDALPVRDRGMLGASDHEVWHFAQEEERAVVTINGKHFRPFAVRAVAHSGIVIIPSGGTREEQLSYLVAAAKLASNNNISDPNLRNMVVEIRQDVTALAEEVRAGEVIPLRATRR